MLTVTVWSSNERASLHSCLLARVCFVHAFLTALTCYCRISNGTRCWADGSRKVDVTKIIRRTKTSSDSSESSSTSVNKRVKIVKTKQGQQFLTGLFLKYDWSIVVARWTLNFCWKKVVFVKRLNNTSPILLAGDDLQVKHMQHHRTCSKRIDCDTW